MRRRNLSSLRYAYAHRASTDDDVTIRDDEAIFANHESGAQRAGWPVIAPRHVRLGRQQASNDGIDLIGIDLRLRPPLRTLRSPVSLIDPLLRDHDRDHARCNASHQGGIAARLGATPGAGGYAGQRDGGEQHSAHALCSRAERAGLMGKKRIVFLNIIARA
jgi:hypothetical protein